MRYVAVCVLMAVLWPSAAAAQSANEDGSKKLIKILAGAGAVTLGTMIAAKSSQSTTVTTPVGKTETSSFSTSQLVTGLTVAGVGGLVLWSGLKQHSESRPLAVGVGMDRHTKMLFVRRSW